MERSEPIFQLSPDTILGGDTPGLAQGTQGQSVDQAVLQRTQAELMRFQELLSQVGRELAEPLTTALERIDALVGTGKIDRAGLKALLSEVTQARQAGIQCQQITRLATGRVHPSHERVHLTHTLQSVLSHRTRELQARGLAVHQTLEAVEVRVDASMLFALLNSLIDWAAGCACGAIEWSLAMQPWPAHGILRLRVVTGAIDQWQEGVEAPQPDGLQALSWHLADQYARSMGLQVTRSVMPWHVDVQIEFPGTVAHTLLDDGLPLSADAPGFSSTLNSRPLAGSHVLVVAHRRDLRLLVRESLRAMGLVVDFVSTVTEAVTFCRDGLPHALVFESSLKGMRLDQLLESIRLEAPDFVAIEVLEEGQLFELSDNSATGMARVGREALLDSLPAALVHELTRVG
jgi:CheY-like chemotaxis protein